MKNSFVLTLVAIIIMAGISQAQPSNSERIQKLEDLCKQQEQQIEQLQGQLGVLQNEDAYKTYTERIVKSYLTESEAQEDDGITAGYENGFFIRSADAKFELKINGYLQAGIGIFETNTFDNNSFFLHGAYLMFDVRMMEKWRAFIKVNFAHAPFADQFQDGGTYDVELADAFIEYRLIPEVNFVAGNTLVPFSIEGQYAENEGLSIWQEPFINSWSHGLDVGFLMHGIIAKRLGYRLGIFNGEGSNTLNHTDDMMFAGQLRFYLCDTDKNTKSFIHAGFLRSRNAEVSSISVYAPWGREVFDGGSATGEDSVEGWRTAVDAGARLEFGFDNGSALRLEGEYMYSTWQRENAAGRLAWLRGHGFWVGTSYRHCFRKDIEESGLILLAKFSLTDIDNKETDDAGNIVGQNACVYTAGVGYAFNKHMAVNFNWVMLDLERRKTYGTSKDSGHGGALEHAWFVQFSTNW